MRIAFIGDIVGRPARKYLGEKLFAVRKELSLDCVIANGENASGGSGLTPDNARELFSAGIDILTSGDHIFKKKVITILSIQTSSIKRQPLKIRFFESLQGTC